MTGVGEKRKKRQFGVSLQNGSGLGDSGDFWEGGGGRTNSSGSKKESRSTPRSASAGEGDPRELRGKRPCSKKRGRTAANCAVETGGKNEFVTQRGQGGV